MFYIFSSAINIFFLRVQASLPIPHDVAQMAMRLTCLVFRVAPVPLMLLLHCVAR